MICCWIVTSRAVVGSSAISTLGRSARAMAMTTRWRMPPENSCGYARAARAGPRDADVGEHLDGPRPAASCARPPVGAQHLGDLLADAHQRVQRRHRVLVHHRHLGAADGAPGRPRPSPARRGRRAAPGRRRSPPAAPGAAPSPTASSATSRIPTRRRGRPSRRPATSKSTPSTMVTGPPSRCSTVVRPRTDRTASFMCIDDEPGRRRRSRASMAGKPCAAGQHTAEHGRAGRRRSPTATLPGSSCTVRKPMRANR